ncbi:MAG: hypothetical protein DDT28_00711 [Dehalococcoidia bacterium]|nr:hypothetical protein [Chloroflexota bacterium]
MNEFRRDPEGTKALWADLRLAFVSSLFSLSEIFDHVKKEFGAEQAEVLQSALDSLEEAWKEEEPLLLRAKDTIVESVNINEIAENIPIITKCEWKADELVVFPVVYDVGLMLQEVGSAYTFPKLNIIVVLLDTSISWVKSHIGYLANTVTHELIHNNVEFSHDLGWTRDRELWDVIFDEGVVGFLAGKVLASLRQPIAAKNVFGELDAALMDRGYVSDIDGTQKLMVEWYETYFLSPELFDRGLKVMMGKIDQLEIEHFDVREILAEGE